MKRKIERRTFLKTSAAIGATALISPPLLLEAGSRPDVSVAAGEDALSCTIKAVEKLGGMERFVPKNSKVAVLANAQKNNPGTYTHPELLRAVVRMCRQAGASEVRFLSWLPAANWESTGQRAAIEAEGGVLELVSMDEADYRTLPLEKGVALKEARIMNAFFSSDVFINMPITKDHAGNLFTATLKNLMGLNSPKANRSLFHRPDWKTNPEAIGHLDQCIADLNLAVRPSLCIVDATEFIVTEGPFGPGKLLAPRKVVAGTDRVAIDAYCCQLWGLEPSQIQAITRAAAHGLGELNLKKIKVKESRA